MEKILQELIEKKLLSAENLDGCRPREDESMLEALLRLKFLDEEQYLIYLSEKTNLPYRDWQNEKIHWSSPIDRELIVKYQFLPLEETEEKITIGISRVEDLLIWDDLRFVLGKEIELILISPLALKLVLRSLEFLSSLPEEKSQKEEPLDFLDSFTEEEDSWEEEDVSPVIRLAEKILQKGEELNASDFFLRPGEKEIQFYARLWGKWVKQDSPVIPYLLHKPLSTRLKILAQMDIAERRLPQVGSLRRGDPSFSVIMRTLPTLNGEEIYLHYPIASRKNFSQESTLMPPLIQSQLKAFAKEPGGMLIMTGNQGEQKKRILYGWAQEAFSPEQRVVAIDEYFPQDYPFASLLHVNTAIGLSYERLLRNVLPTNPDLIILGDIRSIEAAEIALRASREGIKVIASLFSGDITRTFFRFLDMGIEPYVVMAALKGVCRTFSLRILCSECKEATGDLDYPFREKGCSHCYHTGYQGEKSIYQTFFCDSSFYALFRSYPESKKIEKYVKEKATLSLGEQARKMAQEGLVSYSETLPLEEF